MDSSESCIFGNTMTSYVPFLTWNETPFWATLFLLAPWQMKMNDTGQALSFYVLLSELYKQMNLQISQYQWIICTTSVCLNHSSFIVSKARDLSYCCYSQDIISIFDQSSDDDFQSASTDYPGIGYPSGTSWYQNMRKKQHLLGHMFEDSFGSTWPDLADLLAWGLAAPVTQSYIINVIIAPYDLHYNMEMNIPPSRMHSLYTSLTPQPLCKIVAISWREPRCSIWQGQTLDWIPISILSAASCR